MEHQTDLFSLFPGAPGGRTLAAERGPAYFKQIGARGGQRTRDLYGHTHLAELARRGGRECRRRRHTWPRTILSWDGVTYRLIPYWPPKSSPRRRKPRFVYIEQQTEGGVL